MNIISAQALWKWIYNPRPGIHPILYWIGMSFVLFGVVAIVTIVAIMLKITYIVLLTYF